MSEQKNNQEIDKAACGNKKESCPMEKLKKAWGSEKKEEKIYIGLALAVFIASFLPWSSSHGYFSYSISAWGGVGYIAILASVSILLLWGLPVFGVTLPKIFSNKEQEKKILSAAVLASPIIWIFQSFSYLRFLGIGLWVTLAIGAYMVYVSFKKDS
jgi:hypothetical protein